MVASRDFEPGIQDLRGELSKNPIPRQAFEYFIAIKYSVIFVYNSSLNLTLSHLFKVSAQNMMCEIIKK